MSDPDARRLERGGGSLGGIVGVCDTVEGFLAVVVVAGGANVRPSKVAASEAKVAGAQRAVAVVERVVVRGNVGIVSDTATRVAPEVPAEAVQA